MLYYCLDSHAAFKARLIWHYLPVDPKIHVFFHVCIFVNTYLSVMDKYPCDPPAAAPRPLDTLFSCYYK